MSLFKKLAKYQIENQDKAKLNGITFTASPKTNSGFSLNDICSFQDAIFNIHELARERFIATNSEEDAIIAIDACVAIQDLKKENI